MGLERSGVETTVNRSHHRVQRSPKREIPLAQGGEFVAGQITQRKAGGRIEQGHCGQQGYVSPFSLRYFKIAATDVSLPKSSTSNDKSKVCSRLNIKFTWASESHAAKSLSDVSLLILSGGTFRVVATIDCIFGNKSMIHSLSQQTRGQDDEPRCHHTI